MEAKMDENINNKSYIIVRQPIFDRNKNVIAYNVDLKDINNFKNIDKIFNEELKKISYGKKIYVHFNIDLIKNNIPFALPNNKIGINIEGTLVQDADLLEKLKQIKLKGFDLIIDGFYLKDTDSSILNLANIFTVDFRIEEMKNKKSVFNTEEQKIIKLLARDVETESDFALALDKGFDYFQGNFFTRPDIIPIRDIPSFKLNLIKLLEELNKSDILLSEIEEILKRDVALTYKLFKFINSANIGTKTTVTSISHALTLLGEIEVKKWLSIMVISSISSDKPDELLRLSLVRSKFCELIAEELGFKKEKSDYFLTGMFSLMDAFVGRPLAELILELPIKEDIKIALLGTDNQLLRTLNLVKNYENGNWDEVQQALIKTKLPKNKISEFYNDAIEWSNFIDYDKT
jgi:EAL and modified HD-GYP domain-containing signal transduction protein